MSTVVFVMLPETGHVNASLKLAKSLRARGHRVCYLGLPGLEPVFARHGLEFVPLFEQTRADVSLEAIKSSNLEILDALQSLLGANRSTETLLALLHAELRKALAKLRPDLFVIDVVFPGVALAAAQAGLPVWLLNSMLMNPLLVRESAGAAGEAAAVEAVLRLPELILCPEQFDFPAHGNRGRPCHYVEASIDLERGEVPFPWERVEADKPLVYCAFGSESRLYGESRLLLQKVFDAFAGAPGWQLVASLGAHLSPEDFRRLPADAILVQTAPQLELLRRASLTINHGGLNSIKESLFFGVPMIVFPFINDQPANAARVEYHGLGVRGDRQKTSPEQIRAYAERIDGDPSFRARVGRMSRTFKEMEQASRGVALIEARLPAGRTSSPGDS